MNCIEQRDYWLLLEIDRNCSHTKPITWRIC